VVSTDRPLRGTRAPRLLFAGGGTLGHIMPGLAVCEEVRRRWPEAAVLFVTSANAQTAGPLNDTLAGRGLRVATVETLRRRRPALRGLPGLTGGLFAALRLLRRFRPDVVVGLGGYASVPAVLAADLLRVPTVLLEQNALPGRANRLLARWAEVVCCAWPGSEAHLPRPHRVRFTGNPVRREVSAAVSPERAAPFGGPASARRKKTLLVLGGSNGARPINDLIVRCLPMFERAQGWLRIVHSTGTPHYEAVRSAYARHRVEAVVAPFVKDMAAAYRVSDLVVCRAGGTSLAEVCAAGRAAVVIPFPYAADDHQRRNAEVLARAGAAVVLDQFATTPAALGREVLALLNDDARRRRMASRSLALGRPGAAGSVVAQIEAVVGRRRAVGPGLPGDR